MGLDDRFDNARSQILGTNPLPSLNLVYNRLLQEEGVRSFSHHKPDPKPDPMAFAARVHPSARPSRGGRDNKTTRPSHDGSKPVCSACQRTWHTLKTCFRVTGYFPDWWDDRPRDRIHITSHNPDLSQPVLVPDIRGQELFGRTKQKNASTPHVNMTSAQTGKVPPTSSFSLSSLDRIDLNSLTPSELEELTLLW
ncbi:hypothetical protein vseg_000660 [Gypsophila vaccaria]